MNKNVLNKLAKIESKVELAEVKVELSLMDDLDALVKKHDEEIKSAFAVRSQGKDLIRQGIQNEKNAQAYANDGIKIANNILAQMKDLGIQDPNINNTIKYFQSKIAGSKDRLKFIEKAITSFN